MAFLPALLAATPAIISGIDKALDVMDKFAPTVNRVSSMLFKGHKKSPSNLLEKIQNNKAQKELVTDTVKQVMKRKSKNRKILDNLDTEETAVDKKKYSKKANKNVTKKTSRSHRSYHSVLERL